MFGLGHSYYENNGLARIGWYILKTWKLYQFVQAKDLAYRKE